MARTLSLAAIQTSYGMDLDANIAKTEGFIRQAAANGAQVILPSELFQGPYFCVTQEEQWFAAAHPWREHPCVTALAPYLELFAAIDQLWGSSALTPELVTVRDGGQWHVHGDGGLQRGDDVQQIGKVAIFGRGNTVVKAIIDVVRRIKPGAPSLVREGRIGNDEIEGLEGAVRVLEMWIGQRVVAPDFCGRAVVQHHVHFGEGAGRNVLFLPVDGNARGGFIPRL